MPKHNTTSNRSPSSCTIDRVHASVLDPRSDQPRDRAEAGAALKRHPEASTHPVDVLLIVDRDNPTRTAGLREEAVEAVKRAHVKHATARKTIRAEHPKAVAVITGDARRVDPRRERERVKPERNRITDALGVQSRRADRIARRRQPARHRTSRGSPRSPRPRLHGPPTHQLQSLVHTTFTRAVTPALTRPDAARAPRDTRNLGFGI